VPYLAQLLAGYRNGLNHDPPESDKAVRAELAGENDAYQRGLLLGLLANSLTKPDRSSSKIGETTESQRAVTEAIQRPRTPHYARRFEVMAESAHMVVDSSTAKS
jgi:hypothetical protein